MSIATIKTKGGITFHLHKDILTEESACFDKALKEPFIESQTQLIDLDDIEPRYFGI